MWFQDSSILSRLKDDPAREEWTDWKAAQRFNAIVKALPKEYRDRSRVGTVSVREIEGSEGEQVWLVPIEGFPKILGPKNRVTLFDAEGKTIFEGLWGQTDADMILSRVECFLWLPPRVDAEKPAWTDRARGFFRLLRHKLGRGKIQK